MIQLSGECRKVGLPLSGALQRRSTARSWKMNESRACLALSDSATSSRGTGRAALLSRAASDLFPTPDPDPALIAAACVGDKWGFINATGDFAIPPQFDEVHGFSEGLAAVRIKQRWGWIDCAGNLKIPCRYAKVTAFREGAAVVTHRGERGLLDTAGRFVGLPGFEVILPPVEGLAKVQSKKRTGFVNAEGTFVIEPRQGDFDHFSGGFARFSRLIPPAKCVRFGYIDPNGREVVPPILDDAGPFAEGVACATRTIVSLDDMHWGCIDGQGEFVIPEKFHQIWRLGRFDRGVLAVRVNGKWGYIDRKGNYLVNPRFGNWGLFREGLASVEDHTGCYGFINPEGSFVIAPRFQAARPFSEGLAAVEISGKWGYISRGGEIEIPPQFDGAEEFADGIAQVMWKSQDAIKRGFVTAAGKIVVSEAGSLRRFQHGFIGLSEDGKCGFIDRNGELAIPLKFDRIRRAHSEPWPTVPGGIYGGL